MPTVEETPNILILRNSRDPRYYKYAIVHVMSSKGNVRIMFLFKLHLVF